MINAKRLLNVAKALRESPSPKMFTMETFVYGSEDDAVLGLNTGPEFCGTPACALGHYGSRRDLQRLFKIEVATLEDAEDKAELVYADTCPVGYDDTEVVRHFGISFDDCQKLFSPEGCGGAKSVKAAAKYIEKFVASRLKEEGKR